jgi:hypothetical protein
MIPNIPAVFMQIGGCQVDLVWNEPVVSLEGEAIDFGFELPFMKDYRLPIIVLTANDCN